MGNDKSPNRPERAIPKYIKLHKLIFLIARNKLEEKANKTKTSQKLLR